MPLHVAAVPELPVTDARTSFDRRLVPARDDTWEDLVFVPEPLGK
jgi:hypothetical protein